MVQNKNLCTHDWRFGFSYDKIGYKSPVYVIVLFCCKCAKVKREELK